MRDEGAWLVGELTFELTHRHVFTYIHVQALKIQQYVGELSSVSQWYFSQPAQTSKKKSLMVYFWEAINQEPITRVILASFEAILTAALVYTHCLPCLGTKQLVFLSFDVCSCHFMIQISFLLWAVSALRFDYMQSETRLYIFRFLLHLLICIF